MFTLLGKGVSSVASLLQSVAGSGGSAATTSTGAAPENEEEANHEPKSPVNPIVIPHSSRLYDFLRSVEQKTAQPLVVLKIPPTPAAAVTSETLSSVTEQPDQVLDETIGEGEMGRRSYVGAGPRHLIPKTREPARKTTSVQEPGDIIEGTGVVTIMEDCMPKGVIDGQYFFDKACCAPEIKRGSKVLFRAKKTESSLQWDVQFVKLYISPEELEKRDLRKTKTVVGEIANISHGVVFLKYGKKPDEIQEIPLPAVFQGLQYPPWLGDYLRVKIQIDNPDSEEHSMGRILFVEPTQRKTVVGRVTRNNKGVMSIENYIFFNLTVCSNKEMRPSLHDCVCAVAVESSQDGFQWRAVSVTPSNFHVYTSSTRESEGWLEAENTWSGPLLELQNDKFGVKIQPRKVVTYGGVKIGSTLMKTVEINNGSDTAVSLKSVTVNGDQSVCVFCANFEIREAPDIIAMIPPRSSFSCKVSCSPVMLGSTRELLVFDFGNFRIGRYLTVTALSSDEDMLNEIKVKDVTNGKGREWRQVRCEEAISKMIDESKRRVVRGIQPVRTAFFLSKRLETNSVPKYLWAILKDKDEETLILKHPGIAEDLKIENYMEKFQVALWLEEMENDILRRQYDMGQVLLRRAGEYYSFEVPGLKDFHPPVLMGDPISVYDNADINNLKYEAFVYEIRGNNIYAKFNEQFRIKYDGTYVTVEFRLGRTTYKRCHHAIDLAIKYLEEGCLFPQVGIPIKPARILFLEDEETRSEAEPSQTGSENVGKQEPSAPEAQKPAEPAVKFLNLFPKRHSGNSAPVQPFRASGRNLDRRVGSMKEAFVSDTQGPNFQAGNMKLEWFNKMLNQEQKDAVRRVLRGQGRPTPYIIFGPPGTGKTVTVVEAILQVYMLDRNSRVLVVAPSNSAADVIAVHLAASKQFSPGDFVRLVGFLRQDDQIPESIRDFCNDGENLDGIARHRLIVCTCTTAGQFFQLGLNTGHFTHVFIDEAGYCTEPEAVIAAVLVALDKSGQVILAGDPKQLGPVLMSDVASKCGLSLSFLERLMSLPLYSRDEVNFPIEKYNPIALTKLVKNYRAHPTLLKLPSKLFYDDELVSAAADEDINLCYSLSFTKDKGVPLIFHGIQGTSSRDPDSPSWFNAAEVIEVVNYVRKLRAHGLTNDDIGIITPYRKQVEKLRRALEFGLLQDEIPKVGSVEEFQGGERKVMIMSLVRSVAERRMEKVIDRLSFVFSPKRFNVAVTRAKALLIVVGNPHVLHHDPNWSTFLKYCIELGCYTGCDLPLDLYPTTKSDLKNLESDDGPVLPELSTTKYDSEGEVCDSDND